MFTWKLAFRNKHFLFKFLLSFVLLGVVLFFFADFLNFIEKRQGHVFYDPVLNFFRPRDVSDLIFYTTYGTSIIGLLYTFANPYRTIHLGQMYLLLTLCRIITLYFIPLDPPSNIIPLKDIVLQSTFYSEDGNLKDLFFSGHSATLFLFFFFCRIQWLKWIFFICALCVSVAVVIQHIHYSYDVIAAPLFAYISYFIVNRNTKFYEAKLNDMPQLT